MAIKPGYKTFTFDGESSGDYGVYITGSAVYNSPKRDVELIEIPGRNGDFVQDNGRFENIEVTYPAGIYAESQENFAQVLSDLRNMLASKRGYCRLTDEYNPDEYRMAVYKNGLDVSPVPFQRAGEFDLVFDCKPQRFLVSGEEAVEIGVWGDTDTETGSIVTIEADDMTAIKDLTADIEPIQDLHGYDAPWVGGAGKNKCDNTASSTTASGVTYTVNSDGTVNTSGTGSASGGLTLYSNFTLPAGDYVLSGCPANGSGSTYALTIVINGTAYYDYGSGYSFSLSQDTEITRVRIVVYNGGNVSGKVWKPMIRKSTDSADFAPYENICPISGWDNVTVTRTGKNLFVPDFTYIGKNWNGATNVSRCYMTIPMPQGTYTISLSDASTAFNTFSGIDIGRAKVAMPFSNVTSETDRLQMTSSSTTHHKTVTIDSEYPYIYVAFLLSSGTITEAQINSAKVQVELGSTATTYEAYQGDTYTTALGTTVYGGTLDVTSGVLTVTHGYADLGNLTWTRNTQYNNPLFLAKIDDAKNTTSSSAKANAICSALACTTALNCNDATYDGVFSIQYYFNSSLNLNVVAKGYNDANAFKTAMSGQIIVYELATPTTVQLTAQQIDLLLGQNNIWASSGDVTVEYGQDPNKLINPTLFESKPLLEVEGYGSIKLGDDTIKIENVDMGEVLVHEPYTPSIPNAAHSWFNLETSLLNVGDEITVPGFEITNNMKVVSTWSQASMKTVEVQSTDKVASYSTGITGQHTSYVKFTPNKFTFNYGTAATSETASIEVYFDARTPGGAAVHPTITFTYYAVYDGANRIDFYFSGNNAYIVLDSRVFTIPKITGDSSISALPTVMYIDLDIGEAYGDFSGVIASLNNAVQLPAQLPTLEVGHTDIEFDNTITSLKIKPRWFKI